LLGLALEACITKKFRSAIDDKRASWGPFRTSTLASLANIRLECMTDCNIIAYFGMKSIMVKKVFDTGL
jgi:hypothetical protein